eukprot:COSAG06_NODE_19144_length_851_cov_2.259309_1_plen_56_part_10
MRQLPVAGLLLVLLLRCSGNAFAKQLSWSLPVVEQQEAREPPPPPPPPPPPQPPPP